MEKDDLISRQAAIDAFYHIKCNLQMMDDTHTADKMMHGLYLAENAVKLLPSAQPEPSVQPEIIRCKDCKNWQTDWTPIFANFTPEDHFCSLVDLVTEDDFFCGYAERKVCK